MIVLFVCIAVLFGNCLCCDDDTLKRCSFELEQKMTAIPGFEPYQLDHPVPEQLPPEVKMGMSFFKETVCSYFSKYGDCIEQLTITDDCNARHVWLPDNAIKKGIKVYAMNGDTICPNDYTLTDILSKIKPAVKPNSSPFETAAPTFRETSAWSWVSTTLFKTSEKSDFSTSAKNIYTTKPGFSWFSNSQLTESSSLKPVRTTESPSLKPVGTSDTSPVKSVITKDPWASSQKFPSLDPWAPSRKFPKPRSHKFTFPPSRNFPISASKKFPFSDSWASFPKITFPPSRNFSIPAFPKFPSPDPWTPSPKFTFPPSRKHSIPAFPKFPSPDPWTPSPKFTFPPPRKYSIPASPKFPSPDVPSGKTDKATPYQPPSVSTNSDIQPPFSFLPTDVPSGKTDKATLYQSTSVSTIPEKSSTTPWFDVAVTSSVDSIKVVSKSCVLVCAAGILTRHFSFF